MKKIFLVIMVVAFSLSFLPEQAQAFGFGGYVEGSKGDGEFKYEHSSDFDVDADATGIGFVMDTNLGGKRIFNYRLNVGYEKLNLEDDFGETLELEGLVVANTFGFAMVRNQNFRWWIGPQIRVGAYSGDLNRDSSVNYDLVSFGVGGVMGFNYLTGDFCVSTTLGVLRTGYSGETDEPGPNRDVDGHTNTVFLNVAFMFGN